MPVMMLVMRKTQINLNFPCYSIKDNFNISCVKEKDNHSDKSTLIDKINVCY